MPLNLAWFLFIETLSLSILPLAVDVVIRVWVICFFWVCICIVFVLCHHVSVGLIDAALHFCSTVPASHNVLMYRYRLQVRG